MNIANLALYYLRNIMSYYLDTPGLYGKDLGKPGKDIDPSGKLEYQQDYWKGHYGSPLAPGKYRNCLRLKIPYSQLTAATKWTEAEKPKKEAMMAVRKHVLNKVIADDGGHCKIDGMVPHLDMDFDISISANYGPPHPRYFPDTVTGLAYFRKLNKRFMDARLREEGICVAPDYKSLSSIRKTLDNMMAAGARIRANVATHAKAVEQARKAKRIGAAQQRTIAARIRITKAKGRITASAIRQTTAKIDEAKAKTDASMAKLAATIKQETAPLMAELGPHKPCTVMPPASPKYYPDGVEAAPVDSPVFTDDSDSDGEPEPAKYQVGEEVCIPGTAFNNYPGIRILQEYKFGSKPFPPMVQCTVVASDYEDDEWYYQLRYQDPEGDIQVGRLKYGENWVTESSPLPLQRGRIRPSQEAFDRPDSPEPSECPPLMTKRRRLSERVMNEARFRAKFPAQWKELMINQVGINHLNPQQLEFLAPTGCGLARYTNRFSSGLL